MDSFPGPDLGGATSLVSPVTLQMQKHLLSSTLQTTVVGDAARIRSARNGSCSPTAALRYTPTPSPSPLNPLALSMNSSLPDLGLSISGDNTKAIQYLQDLKQNTYTSAGTEAFDDIDVERLRTPISKYSYLSSLTPLPLGSSVASGMSPVSRFSPQMELNSVLSFAEQSSAQNAPVSTEESLKGYLVMEPQQGGQVSSSLPLITPPPVQSLDNLRLLSMPDVDKSVKLMPVSMTSQITPVASVEILPKPASAAGLRLVPEMDTCNLASLNPVSSNQLACITGIPTMVSNGLTCLTNIPTTTRQMTCLSAVPSISSIDSIGVLTTPSSSGSQQISSGFQAYPSSSVAHQNKKRRLLTFLADENKQGILVNPAQPNKSETFILSSSGPSMVSDSSQSEALFLAPTQTIAATKPQTIFLNSDGSSLVSGGGGKAAISSTIYLGSGTSTKSASPGVYLNQTETKNEPTLIIDSGGAQATLLTPVTANEQTILASQTQRENLLEPVNDGDNLVTGQLIQTSAVSYAPGPAISFQPVLNTSFTVEALTGNDPEIGSMSGVDSVTVQFPSVRNSSTQSSKFGNGADNLIEKMAVFKCKICGFISTTAETMDIHILDDHEDKLASSKFDEETNWMKVAQRNSVKLGCPLCPNLFSSERSFKVHLTEDHLLSDIDAIARYRVENERRKKKAMVIIREEKERRKLERRRLKQNSYEAYIDTAGELRVRSAGFSVSSVQHHEDEDVDVEGDEVSGAVVTEKHPVGGIDVKATDYVDFLLKQRSGPITSEKQEQKELNSRPKEKALRIKVGRPKGSRTMGMSMLRKVDPNVSISEEIMGEECLVENCAVRLKDPVKLELHRSSHQDNGVHQCPECQEIFKAWPKCALHLWREHGQDLGLYACDKCDYRSFTLKVMERHKLSHVEEKPFLCPDCGRAVKNDKQLKKHMRVVHKLGPDGAKLEYVEQFMCDICNQELGSSREVRYHKERVHERKKPFLCVHCGYTAFSNSSLKLHLRSHTGDKPYSCKECSYRTGDHNSLRRHMLRHSGEKPYRCPHCPYAAIQSTTYKVHLKKKHPDKPDQMFECKECGFASVQEKLLNAHSCIKE